MYCILYRDGNTVRGRLVLDGTAISEHIVRDVFVTGPSEEASPTVNQFFNAALKLSPELYGRLDSIVGRIVEICLTDKHVLAEALSIDDINAILVLKGVTTPVG